MKALRSYNLLKPQEVIPRAETTKRSRRKDRSEPDKLNAVISHQSPKFWQVTPDFITEAAQFDGVNDVIDITESPFRNFDSVSTFNANGYGFSYKYNIFKKYQVCEARDKENGSICRNET